MDKEYSLFEGFDFGSFVFHNDLQTAVTVGECTASHRDLVTSLRPILKTDEDVEPKTSAMPFKSDAATSNHHTVPRFPIINGSCEDPHRESRSVHHERLRSQSCSSGGSDAADKLTVIQCAFCRKNGETREFYSTHSLKDWRGMVVCPVLRAYKCPHCGATGDQAHTESHCPLACNETSLMASLRSRRTSSGKKAYKRKQ